MKCRNIPCSLLVCCLFPITDRTVEIQARTHELSEIGLGSDQMSSAFGSPSERQEDSADVAIVHTTAYPGHFTEIEVLLKNPMPIIGFQLLITISNPDLINFHTDSVFVDTFWFLVDTCTGPVPHDSGCFIDSLIPTPVRHCHIDTVGSLISDFQVLECVGDTGDTSLPDCKWVQVMAIASLTGDGDTIPPDTSYRVLFKLGVDALCVSDTVTDRVLTFWMSPDLNSFLADPWGNVVHFRYHPGQLTVAQSVSGDAGSDGAVNVSDIVFLIGYFFRDGPEPCVMEAADPNGDCVVDPADIVYLINYLFRQGPPPQAGCTH
jgi:hypothetical protein